MKLLDEAKYLRKDAIYEDYYKIIKNLLISIFDF